ncbi:CDP-diacylglycerol--glycerol-3-phosphate 3-phosphatidyltransferase [Cellulomonas citrea]|uniref:CDP-diacylglycerol--glycerol-3-phosphate 3-phosphatidyltransferase n=1 Tax=Cellulomonas citrea TaxID=1909423 RepID=UPI00135B0E30|nr:CDP-diacylglycerol--glycerol-3-phosphate 3-phosphatidyltransferase [Cellulomonas citrea]
MVEGARGVWTLPNVLTMARIALVPVFALVFLLDGGTSVGARLAATALFVLAAVTDKVDGWLARRWGQITDLGKLLDPIADKLLIGTALCLLSWVGELPWWITVVVLVRELGITVLRFFLLRYVVLPASRGGKLKTALQSVAIGLFLLPLAHLPAAVGWVAWVVMAAAVVVTVVTGLDYVRVAVRIRRAGTTVA